MEEPLARVHYEAMAAGLPLITTDRGGNGEILENGKNGFCLEDYSNSEGFSSAIEILLEDRELVMRMGEYGEC